MEQNVVKGVIYFCINYNHLLWDFVVTEYLQFDKFNYNTSFTRTQNFITFISKKSINNVNDLQTYIYFDVVKCNSNVRKSITNISSTIMIFHDTRTHKYYETHSRSRHKKIRWKYVYERRAYTKPKQNNILINISVCL